MDCWRIVWRAPSRQLHHSTLDPKDLPNNATVRRCRATPTITSSCTASRGLSVKLTAVWSSVVRSITERFRAGLSLRRYVESTQSLCTFADAVASSYFAYPCPRGVSSFGTISPSGAHPESRKCGLSDELLTLHSLCRCTLVDGRGFGFGSGEVGQTAGWQIPSGG
jgi:hypothetical protein